MATRELEATVDRHGATVAVDLIGDIDGAAGPALERAYAEATAGGAPPGVLLRFAGVGYINSTGIAHIVALLQQARRDGVEVSASGLSAHYREIFDITRLIDFVTITDDDGDVSRG